MPTEVVSRAPADNSTSSPGSRPGPIPGKCTDLLRFHDLRHDLVTVLRAAHRCRECRLARHAVRSTTARRARALQRAPRPLTSSPAGKAAAPMLERVSRRSGRPAATLLGDRSSPWSGVLEHASCHRLSGMTPAIRCRTAAALPVRGARSRWPRSPRARRSAARAALGRRLGVDGAARAGHHARGQAAARRVC